MTDWPTLPSVPCTQTAMCLLPCHLLTRARPSVWCHLNLDSSVMIKCHQWRVSQTRWRLAHWLRCRWCTKVSLGHRAGLGDWYYPARRCRVMVCTDRGRPVLWSNWDLNLGLDRKLLAFIILSKYGSSRGVKMERVKRPLISRCSLPSPLKDFANGTLCDTHKSKNINLSEPFTRELNNELQYFTWNMARYCKIQTRWSFQPMGFEWNHLPLQLTYHLDF